MENSTQQSVAQENLTQLEVRLNDPDTAAMLNRLLDRLEDLEKNVSTVASTMGQGTGLVAMTGDIVDETYRKAAESGVDLEERLTVGMGLLNRLTEPATAKRLEDLLVLSEQLPGMVAMVGDIVDDAYQSAAQSGIDIEGFARQGAKAATQLGSMMDSGMLDDETIASLGNTAQALKDSQQMPPQKLGTMGLMRAMRDPDVQKTMGYLVNFAKAFGQRI